MGFNWTFKDLNLYLKLTINFQANHTMPRKSKLLSLFYIKEATTVTRKQYNGPLHKTCIRVSEQRTMKEAKAAFLSSKNSVALVRERTIPTERPPPVGGVSANFCGSRGVTWLAQRVPTAVNLCFLNLEPLLFLFK